MGCDSETPVVSVVMPLYNKAAEVARAIGSVLDQSVSDFELIVVDDGSTDAGALVAAGIADPRIRVLHQTNSGVSAARNKGIAEARADLIAFIDADDQWKPDFLETVLRLCNSCPGCDLFVTAYRYSTPHGQERAIYFQGMPAHPWEGVMELPLSNDFDPPISMSAFAVTKQAILSVGGFPEDIAVGEDLLTRLKLMLRFQLAYSTNPCSIYWKASCLAENRKPQYPDLVGSHLEELLSGLTGAKARELRTVISSWHRRRGIMNITFGISEMARYEIGKAMTLREGNLDLLVLYAAARIPCALSRPLLKVLVHVKMFRRRLTLLRQKGRETATS